MGSRSDLVKWVEEGDRRIDRVIAIVLFATAMLLGFFLADSQAATPALSLRDVATRADVILFGRVERMAFRAGDYEGLGMIPFTAVTVKVEGTLKGEATPTVTLSVPGGEFGDTVLVCAEAPRFEVGERVLVFLRRVGVELRIYGLEKGKYTLHGDQVVGRAGDPVSCIVRLRDLASRIERATRSDR